MSYVSADQRHPTQLEEPTADERRDGRSRRPRLVADDGDGQRAGEGQEQGRQNQGTQREWETRILAKVDR